MEKGKYDDKERILERIAGLIKKHPVSVASALAHSNTFIENPYDKRELADKVAYALVNNRIFQRNIAIVISHDEVGNLDSGFQLTEESFSNIGGSRIRKDIHKEAVGKIGAGTAAGASTANPIGLIVGAVAGTISAIFTWGRGAKEAKAREEEYKRKLYMELFEEKKTNWTPIIVVGAVLIVGGVVLFITLKK